MYVLSIIYKQIIVCSNTLELVTWNSQQHMKFTSLNSKIDVGILEAILYSMK